MVAVPAFSLAPFALRNLSQEPGRFFISLLICAVSFAVFLRLVRQPKPEQPTTWAQAMLGSMAVFGLFIMIYGVVPHEWLTWADSSLGLREDKILFDTGPVEFSGRALRDIVATVIYIVGLVINTWMWMAWQKRGTAKPKPAPAAATPEPAGTSAFSRPVTKKD